MATLVFTVQGGTPTIVDATDDIQFADGTFDSAILVGAFNSSTHVKTAASADKSAANTPNNVKYIAAGTADWGDGTEACADMLTSEATLKLNFSHGSAVAVTGWKIYYYDGTTPATAPSNVEAYMFEQGEAAWTKAEGSGTPVNLADGSSATSHDRYIAMSISPDTVGIKTAIAVGTELTYS